MYIFISLFISFVPYINLLDAQTGTFTDTRDNKIYKWVKINNQIWMAENLAYLPFVFPPSKGVFKEDKKEPIYYVYDYWGNSVVEAKKTNNYKTYGVLYNYTAAKESCPCGWHLPSDKEFMELELNLGLLSDELDEVFYRTSGNVGEKLKSRLGWFYNGNGEDFMQFSALPSGFRHHDRGDLSHNNNGLFSFLGSEAYFWTSTEEEDFAYRRQLSSSSKGIVRFLMEKDMGYSVRCIKDND